MTDDLAQFLRDRLDEEGMLAEQAAECGAPSWDRAADVLLLPGLANRRRLAERGVEGALDGAVDAHHARHDPARVLAEVDAKRRIMDLHCPVDPFDGSEEPGWLECAACGPNNDDEPIIAAPGAGEPEWHPCTTLRLLALPYADHADYREEWRP